MGHSFALDEVYKLPLKYEKEFRPFLEPTYWVQPEKNRLSKTVQYRFKMILISKVQVDKQHSKLPLNLIKWPSEDKLIYRIGNIILNQR